MATEAPRRVSSRIASRPAAPDAAPAGASKAKAAPKRKAADDKKEAEPKKSKAAAAAAPAKAGKKSDVAKAQLKVGDALPSLTLKNQDGEDLDVATLRNAVIFTYPKANTPGCTNQACCFRDEVKAGKFPGYEVYGLSNDSPATLKNWKTKKELQYDLLSDPTRELIGQLTGSIASTVRSHFVISDGKLADIQLKVVAKDSAASAVAFIENK